MRNAIIDCSGKQRHDRLRSSVRQLASEQLACHGTGGSGVRRLAFPDEPESIAVTHEHRVASPAQIAAGWRRLRLNLREQSAGEPREFATTLLVFDRAPA